MVFDDIESINERLRVEDIYQFAWSRSIGTPISNPK